MARIEMGKESLQKNMSTEAETVFREALARLEELVKAQGSASDKSSKMIADATLSLGRCLVLDSKFDDVQQLLRDFMSQQPEGHPR